MKRAPNTRILNIFFLKARAERELHTWKKGENWQLSCFRARSSDVCSPSLASNRKKKGGEGTRWQKGENWQLTCFRARSSALCSSSFAKAWHWSIANRAWRSLPLLPNRFYQGIKQNQKRKTQRMMLILHDKTKELSKKIKSMWSHLRCQANEVHPLVAF